MPPKTNNKKRSRKEVATAHVGKRSSTRNIVYVEYFSQQYRLHEQVIARVSKDGLWFAATIIQLDEKMAKVHQIGSQTNYILGLASNSYSVLGKPEFFQISYKEGEKVYYKPSTSHFTLGQIWKLRGDRDTSVITAVLEGSIILKNSAGSLITLRGNDLLDEMETLIFAPDALLVEEKKVYCLVSDSEEEEHKPDMMELLRNKLNSNFRERVAAQDKDGDWYVAKVLAINKYKVKVHYMGFGADTDEWLPLTRISPFLDHFEQIPDGEKGDLQPLSSYSSFYSALELQMWKRFVGMSEEKCRACGETDESILFGGCNICIECGKRLCDSDGCIKYKHPLYDYCKDHACHECTIEAHDVKMGKSFCSICFGLLCEDDDCINRREPNQTYCASCLALREEAYMQDMKKQGEEEKKYDEDSEMMDGERKCQFDGCTHNCVDDYKACDLHICHVPKCPSLIMRAGDTYCKKHLEQDETCRYAGCKVDCMVGYKGCVHHKCSYGNCGEVETKTSIYCEKHEAELITPAPKLVKQKEEKKCQLEGCREVSSAEYCELHSALEMEEEPAPKPTEEETKCQYDSCEEECITGFKGCLHHICSDGNCGEVETKASIYCKTHTAVEMEEELTAPKPTREEKKIEIKEIKEGELCNECKENPYCKAYTNEASYWSLCKACLVASVQEGIQLKKIEYKVPGEKSMEQVFLTHSTNRSRIIAPDDFIYQLSVKRVMETMNNHSIVMEVGSNNREVLSNEKLKLASVIPIRTETLSRSKVIYKMREAGFRPFFVRWSKRLEEEPRFNLVQLKYPQNTAELFGYTLVQSYWDLETEKADQEVKSIANEKIQWVIIDEVKYVCQ